MGIKVILGKEKVGWNESIRKVPQHGVFYTWEYNALNAQIAGAEAELFVYEKDGVIIIYPYIKKQISKIFGSDKGGKSEEWYDITTVEYGGPQKNYEWCEDNFQEEFKRYCGENRIVTEFARIHPFFNSLYCKNAASYKKDVHYINLTDPLENILKNFKKSNRNSITRAKKEGIGIIRTTSTKDIKSFYEIYRKTMERRGSSDFYYYSEKYFKKLIEKMPNNIQLFLAYRNKEPIAGALFLSEKDIVHYHLSGRSTNNTINGTMNLLLWEAIQWAKSKGFSIFSLGGGHEPNDSLSRFKASFTKSSASFKRYTYIHNRSKYEELEALWKLRKGGLGNQTYFPVYRG